MVNIAVVFGGVSCEHDISIITGVQVVNNLDINKYNIYPIYITKNGKWLYNKEFSTIDRVLCLEASSKKCCFVPNDQSLYKISSFGKMKRIVNIDVVVVAMHGKNGEDGMIKAICDASKIKCVCSNTLPSALSLDKVISKKFLSGLDGVRVLNSVNFKRGDDINQLKKSLINNNITYPIILKPANLGSSIGISVCHKEDELEEKLNYCLRFDRNILIEPKLSKFKEYNIAILRSRDGLIVSEIEQPINADEILSYSDKYIGGGKSNNAFVSKRIFPAKISKEIKKELQNVATYVYTQMDLKGVARFDFLMDCDSKLVYLNEMNTIPGSFANYLFTNLTFAQILDLIIDYEYFDKQCAEQLIEYFSSSVLTQYKGAKSGKIR